MLTTFWRAWQTRSGDRGDLTGLMAAQAAAVLRDKRKRWAKLHLNKFHKKNWKIRRKLISWSAYFPSPYWKFSLASERRKPEEEGEDDTSIPVSFFCHISFFFCHHSVAKNFSYQNSLFVPPAFQTSLYVRLSFSTFISIDLLRKHVTFLIGQFNGNRVPMKNLELADCHSASPYIPPSNGKSTLNGK